MVVTSARTDPTSTGEVAEVEGEEEGAEEPLEGSEASDGDDFASSSVGDVFTSSPPSTAVTVMEGGAAEEDSEGGDEEEEDVAEDDIGGSDGPEETEVETRGSGDEEEDDPTTLRKAAFPTFCLSMDQSDSR